MLTLLAVVCYIYTVLSVGQACSNNLSLLVFFLNLLHAKINY